MTYSFVSLLAVLACMVLSGADPLHHSSAPRKPSGTCPPRDGAFPTYLADDTDCSIYYECSNGVAVEHECPAEMLWNSKLITCDWAINVDCSANNTQESAVISIKPLTAVGVCPPRDGAFPAYLADDTDCSIYYECSNGIAVENVCPAEMLWNSKLNTCDWAINVDCSANNTQASAVISIKPLTAVGTCPPKDGAIPIYLADDKDCSIYYECSNGLAVQNTCPPDMWWNAKLNTCDWEDVVTCSTNNATLSAFVIFVKPMSAVGACPTQDGAFPTYLADDTDCGIYYECSNGVAVQNVCPTEMLWNSKLNTCDWAINVNCPSNDNATESL